MGRVLFTSPTLYYFLKLNSLLITTLPTFYNSCVVVVVVVMVAVLVVLVVVLLALVVFLVGVFIIMCLKHIIIKLCLNFQVCFPIRQFEDSRLLL